MEFVGFPKIARYSRECIVTEKIDGTNGQIYIPEETPNDMFVGSRTRWLTPENDNHGLAKWCYANMNELIAKLGPGRHFGEWWGQGIQRNYGLKEKRFSLFNVARWKDDTIRPTCCSIVPILWQGGFDEAPIADILGDLEFCGSKAAPGFMKPEGIVIHHVAGNISFKKTLVHDESGKGG